MSARALMRAAIYKTTGPPEVLKIATVPIPQPSANEVLVQVTASGINPSDCKRRAGGRDQTDSEYIIPHSDGAGVITRVGSNINSDRVGERVWLWNARWERDFGTAAEYISIDANQAVYLPDNISFEHGACLGIPAVTAHRCLFSDGPIEGKTVFIAGGTGSVGACAVQLAKWGGASKVGIHFISLLLLDFSDSPLHI
jgi:NADPH:quinone reductase